MPLTEFQRDILRVLTDHRGPGSYLAGGTVINAGPNSPRYSDDVDIFHEAEESVADAADADTALLVDRGFTVKRVTNHAGFKRAWIGREDQKMRLEWVRDSAFRFFPVQKDEEFGWRLHLADLATNKVLALAGRWEARDFVDTLYLDNSFAPFGLLAWAASGKDPGLTPLLVMEMANRFNRLRPEDFLDVSGPGPFDLVAMKTRWREMLDEARELIAALPPEEVGALYLDADNHPVDPRATPGARVHYASLGGVWPQVVDHPFPLPAEAERAADEQLRQRYGRSP